MTKILSLKDFVPAISSENIHQAVKQGNQANNPLNSISILKIKKPRVRICLHFISLKDNTSLI